MRTILPVVSVVASVLLPLLPAVSQAQMFGPDYKPCGDQPNTVATVDCVQAKIRMWDQRLNAAYKGLLQRINPAQQAQLKTAERLWLQYRDANCRVYGLQDGTIREIQAVECVRAMTQERASELAAAMKFD